MNILLVEDIESIIKGLTYSLEKSNYKLVIKTTIKDTKEYLLSNTNIDLIILVLLYLMVMALIYL